MNLLALETATSVCGVALLQDDRVTVDLLLDRPRAHAENLVSMIGDTLRYGGLEPADVDAVAVSSGPGSYTGLRIGVSTAKGFASAVGAALVSVPSLQALASRVHATGSEELVGAAFDARRDEAYVALFRSAEEGPPRIEKDTAAVPMSDMEEWLRRPAPDRPILLVGDGWTKMTDVLQAAGVSFRRLPDVRPSASGVARVGADRFESGQTENLVTFEPYYLKDFVTTTPSGTPFEKLSF